MQNNHKTTGEMQSKQNRDTSRTGDLQSSPWAEAGKREGRHRRVQSLPESVSQAALPAGLSGIPEASFPMCFDLSHSRAGISSVFDRIPVKSITSLCYLNTDVLLNRHTGLNLSLIHI